MDSDRTVNKIALCSALFAGCAYVGYSVVRQAFGRNLVNHRAGSGRRDDALEYKPSGRIYLRRLSGSEDALLGTLDPDYPAPGGMGARLILRPLSVQERIRELNLRARHFAETVLAVQMQQGDEQRRLAIRAHTRSLQTSPTRCSPSSGLIFSPIDITHLGSSRCSSIENLSYAHAAAADGGTTSPSNSSSASIGGGTIPRYLRKRWSRRSLKLRGRNRNKSSPDSGTGNGTGAFVNKEEDAAAEAERMLEEREEELRRRLKGFEDGTTKILTPYEAKSLVAMLHSRDPLMLERSLVTVSNSAAFTANQDNLREAGCFGRLQKLLDDHNGDPRVQRAAMAAVGNLALNTANQREMASVVPSLLCVVDRPISDSRAATPDLNNGHSGDPASAVVTEIILVQQALLTLTNVAALSDWHQQFCSSLDRLYDLTQSPSSKVRMLSLRLLVNLSTNEEMVPHLLSAKAPDYVYNMLDDSMDDNYMLRVMTLLANLVCSAHRLKISGNSSGINPAPGPALDARASEPDSIRFSSIFGSDNRGDVIDHLAHLMESHQAEDIRVKARMVHAVLQQTT